MRITLEKESAYRENEILDSFQLFFPNRQRQLTAISRGFPTCQLADTRRTIDLSLSTRLESASDFSNKTGSRTVACQPLPPPKKGVHEAIAALGEESGTASNIKSDTDSKPRSGRLTKTMASLELYNKLRKMELWYFVVQSRPGGREMNQSSYSKYCPKNPVSVYLYRSTTTSTSDPLRDMLREQNVIGILSMDAKEGD